MHVNFGNELAFSENFRLSLWISFLLSNFLQLTCFARKYIFACIHTFNKVNKYVTFKVLSCQLSPECVFNKSLVNERFGQEKKHFSCLLINIG